MRALTAFRKWADSRRVIVGFGAVYLLSQSIIARILEPLNPLDVLRVQTTLSPEVVEATFAHWRATGVFPNYPLHFYFDFPHPLLYAMFLSALLANGLNRRRLSQGWNVVLLLPFAAALCDLFENLSHVAFLSDAANITPLWVAASGLAAISKWLLVAISIGLSLGLAASRVAMERTRAGES